MKRSGFLIAAGLAVVAIGGWMFLSSERPPDLAGGAPIVSVSVPQLGATESQGQTIFDANCAICHGENAAGREGVGPPLVHIIYEPGHHSDASFFMAAKNGVRAHHWRFGNMPPVAGISEDEVAKVIAYVRALQRENGIR